MDINPKQFPQLPDLTSAQAGNPDSGDRRQFIRNAILAIGVAGASLPAFKALAIAPRNRFFSAPRFAVLDALSETIMPRTDTPGARDTLVAARIDGLMKTWASTQSQLDFTRVLDEVDAAARSVDPKGLAALPAARQLDVVVVFDRAKAGDSGYARLKALVFALYYLSEAGATQELRYEHVPGAWEPSIAVTADTRGWAIDVSP